ncbi:MAG: hypothetical protein K0R15_1742 [Clostridiales bacterium]|nr:hypothetical protein [Clostridiales bacterium]
MVTFMIENGYEDMAARMQSIGREQMIEMHNYMRESGGCHGNNKNRKGMMGGRFN